MVCRISFASGRLALIAGAFIALAAAGAEAQLVTYDDFSAALLDQTKWSGRQLDVRVGGTGTDLETRRDVQAGKLLMEMRAVGGAASNSGRYFSENTLQFRNPDPLTEIAFRVRVQQFEVSGCPAGPASFAVARGVYSFFSDGAGDVVAFVEVRRSSVSTAPATELEVIGYLIHRTASGDSLLGFGLLGTATVGQAVKLRTKWDQINQLVEFQRGTDPAVTIPYSQTVMSPPSVRTKLLGALGLVSDCLTGPVPNARMLAVFDNVLVNQ